MVKVLFVCMGNICRSPTAEGVFQELLRKEGLEGDIEIDSAGTHAYHIGKTPDHRARAAALRRGVDLGSLRARQVTPGDFGYFDYILAMDRYNLEFLEAECPAQFRDRLSLFLAYAPDADAEEVPDPYYGGESGFDRVLDLIEAASLGLLERIRRDRNLGVSVGG